MRERVSVSVHGENHTICTVDRGALPMISIETRGTRPERRIAVLSYDCAHRLGEALLKMSTQIVECPECAGSGEDLSDSSRSCHYCHGAKRVTERRK